MEERITRDELYNEIQYEHVVEAMQEYRRDEKDKNKHNNASYYIYFKGEYYPSREIIRRAYEILHPDREVRSNFLTGRGGKNYIVDALKKKEFIVVNLKDNKAVEIESDESFISGINNEFLNNVNVEYTPKPVKKQEPLESKGRIVYIRRKEISINALKRANHRCEVDSKHPGFIRQSDGTNYTEPHHLIPMHMQWYFENSLDVEANIISLCSNCHNLMHYGADKEKEEVLRMLYELRKNELKEAGLDISLIKLFGMYP